MTLDTYGRLELLGHLTLYGHLSTEEIAGIPMIRIDIARGGEQGVETRYFGSGSVYSITPMTEEAVLEATKPPVRRLSTWNEATDSYADEYDRSDDDVFMNARYVSTQEGPGWGHDNMRGMDPGNEAQDERNVVAITMLQSPRLADIVDERWDENTEFIAHARTDIDLLVVEVERLRTLAGAYLVEIEASNAGEYEECDRPSAIDSTAYYALHSALGSTPI
jgi:hypothetical protein